MRDELHQTAISSKAQNAYTLRDPRSRACQIDS